MAHRRTTIKRYKISNDILLLILEKLNPMTLYRTCQAFQRVYNLVMDHQPLRYKFELAVVGMKDGHASRTFVHKLQLLMTYKKDWPRLHWTDEQKIRVPVTATQVDVSGNFLYYVNGQTLDLVELPSCRNNRPPSQTRHLKYNTSQSDSVVIDIIQSLIIAAQTYSGPGGQIGLRLKIRNLWNFDKHPTASSAYYDCSTHVTQAVDKVSLVVCGNRVVVTIDFVGGSTKHLLLDWCTLQAMWLEEQDVTLLSPYLLLAVRKLHGKMALYLYDIYDMRNVSIAREYELPPIWLKSNMRFGRNSAPNSEVSPPNTFFYSDPSSRVLVLTATQNGPNGRAMHWMLINESFFRPTLYADRRSVPWSYWSQFCLIKDFPANTSILVGDPQVVGSRIIYLEKQFSDSGRTHSSLATIDFAPCAETSSPPTRTWTLMGKMSPIRPSETFRELPSATTNSHPVEKIFATEDNVVVVLENLRDMKPVNILTFGVPTSRGSRHDPSA